MNKEWILKSVGATPTILPYSKTYTLIIILGTFFTIINMVLNNSIRAEGNSKYSMYAIGLPSFSRQFLVNISMAVYNNALEIYGDTAIAAGGIAMRVVSLYQSLERGRERVVLASCRNGFFFIPLVYILDCKFGLSGIIASHAVADLLTFYYILNCQFKSEKIVY